MKKFIEALKEKGIMDDLIDFVKEEDNTHADAFNYVTDYINTQVHESEKIDALLKQGAEFLEKEKHKNEGLKKENEEALEDAIVNSFIGLFNSIADSLK